MYDEKNDVIFYLYILTHTKTLFISKKH